MSWRGRDDRGGSRWAEQDKKWNENRTRSPVWELRRSPTPPRDCRSPQRDRYRNRHDRERYERDRDIDRDRRDRYDRDSDRYRGSERYRDRYDRNRDRDRDRERRRSPRGHDDRDIPMPPSPPNISAESNDKFVSRSRSRSDSRDRYDSDSRDSRDRNEDPSALNAFPGDWICKCGSYNFKRRQTCFRHNCNGKKSEGVTYSVEAERAGVVEPTSGITKRLLFRRLDALTTEEKILDTLKERCSKSLIDSIAGIVVGRETLTSASKCLAYINFNSVADSMAAHSELLKLNPPLEIDNRDVLISFYNEPQKPQKPSVKNTDYASYYGHPQNYSNSQCLSEADRVNAAAAVAQSAISAAHARQLSWTPVSAPTFSSSSSQNNSTSKLPTGDGKTTYTAPDTRTFMYDESSGYYYDPATGLYYDGKTQYFYNNQTNQYMYWDASSSTYILASQTQQNTDQPKLPNPPQATVENTITKEPPEEKKKKDKEDKVKVAKKIAKDMERWARTLNQKKENARSNIVMEQPLDTGASKGSADIGFSVLGAGPSLNHVKELSPPPTTSADNFLLKNSAPETEFESDEGIIDWVKLTCLLCKRKFPSADVLTKHKSMSDLHIKNLTEYRKKNEMMPQTNCYRDRAAERRMKFGEDEIPVVRRRYESDVHSSVQLHPPPSVVDTIGGKMLQKMGWSEGRGLGKEGQGRIAPIEAEQRPGLAGLGQKRGIYTPTPGETYRDTVKKLMIARYKEVIGQEETTD